MTPRPIEPEPAQTPEGARDERSCGGGTSRRGFVKLTAAALATLSATGVAGASEHASLDPDRMGVLVDLTVCVGCRRCEWACCEANSLPHGALHEYDDQTVFEQRRYPSAAQLTGGRYVFLTDDSAIVL